MQLLSFIFIFCKYFSLCTNKLHYIEVFFSFEFHYEFQTGIVTHQNGHKQALLCFHLGYTQPAAAHEK